MSKRKICLKTDEENQVNLYSKQLLVFYILSAISYRYTDKKLNEIHCLILSKRELTFVSKILFSFHGSFDIGLDEKT